MLQQPRGHSVFSWDAWEQDSTQHLIPSLSNPDAKMLRLGFGGFMPVILVQVSFGFCSCSCSGIPDPLASASSVLGLQTGPTQPGFASGLLKVPRQWVESSL